MKKISKIFIAVAFFLLLASAPAMAEQKWVADIGIYYSNDSKHLIFGMADGSTDGFDSHYDSAGRFMAGARISAYFYHLDWGLSTPYIWVDMAGLSFPKDYTFYVASTNTGGEHKMIWNLSEVPGAEVPDTIGLILTDESNGMTTDMKAEGSYTYLNTSSTPRSFKVTATGYMADLTPPETLITSAPDEYVSPGDITIIYSATDDMSLPEALLFSYNIDGGSWSAWSIDTSTTLSGLSEGSHTFAVKSIDEAGNEDLTSAEAVFTIDGTVPSLTLNAPDPAELWPVDGKVVPVTISGVAIDAHSAIASITYTLDDGLNGITESGSVVFDVDGNFSFVLNLKAERLVDTIKGKYISSVAKSLGKQRQRVSPLGRIYTITITTVDAVGNEAAGSVEVVVPHSK